MYTVKCYYENGELIDNGDTFDNLDDAYEFAEEMATDSILVDIITPNGRTICVN